MDDPPDPKARLARAAAAVAVRATAKRLRILAYHDVTDPARFSAQMQYLHQRFVPVSAAEVVAAYRGDITLPERAVWVTFDDGHAGVVDVGLPILSEWSVPATIFVCPGLIEAHAPQWWDIIETAEAHGIPLPFATTPRTGASAAVHLKTVEDAERRRVVAEVDHRLRELGVNVDAPLAGLADLERWESAGNHVGNHSWDHPCLDRCPPDEQRRQVREAAEWLHARDPLAPRVFAYPNGNFTPTVEAELGELGYSLALLFDHRLARTDGNPYRVSRLRVSSTANAARFAAITGGIHGGLYHLRRGLQRQPAPDTSLRDTGTEPRVLIVIDRLQDIGGAEGSTALLVSGLHGKGVTFSAVSLFGFDMRDQPALEEQGARFFVPKSHGLLAQVRCVIQAVRATQPDLIHATLARAELAARIAGVLTRTPVITSIVSAPYGEESRRVARSPRRLELYRRLDSFLARHATFAFHTISDAAGDEAVAALGIDPERVSLVPRGRDPIQLGRNTPDRRHRVREQLEIDESTRVILNVGRVDYKKGQTFLVEALAAIPDGAGTVLLIAGIYADAIEALREQIARAGLEDRVRLLGVRDDVPDLLCAADVFAFPSLLEGLGGALLEAMALEVPIVAFDTPAVREAVGDAGILVPLRDVPALADALTDVLTHPERVHALTELGRRRFEDRFTNAQYLLAMLELYQRTVAELRAQEA